jgi:hypothetical protein
MVPFWQSSKAHVPGEKGGFQGFIAIGPAVRSWGELRG